MRFLYSFLSIDIFFVCFFLFIRTQQQSQFRDALVEKLTRAATLKIQHHFAITVATAVACPRQSPYRWCCCCCCRRVISLIPYNKTRTAFSWCRAFERNERILILQHKTVLCLSITYTYTRQRQTNRDDFRSAVSLQIFFAQLHACG